MLINSAPDAGAVNGAQEAIAPLLLRRKRMAQANLPYPDVYIREKDPRYAGLLLDLYTGDEGEFTSSCQYIYQMFFTADEFPDIREILDAVSRCEMKHLFILGDIIRQTDGDPRFWTMQGGRYKLWDGGRVHYLKNPKRMLLDDIERKAVQIRNYKNAMDAVENEDIAHHLQRIRMDEDVHLDLLTGLYEKYK